MAYYVYLSLRAATVPRAVAKNVAEIPMIKLFLVPNIHLLVTTVVSPMTANTNHLSVPSKRPSFWFKMHKFSSKFKKW